MTKAGIDRAVRCLQQRLRRGLNETVTAHRQTAMAAIQATIEEKLPSTRSIVGNSVERGFVEVVFDDDEQNDQRLFILENEAGQG